MRRATDIRLTRKRGRTSEAAPAADWKHGETLIQHQRRVELGANLPLLLVRRLWYLLLML